MLHSLIFSFSVLYTSLTSIITINFEGFLDIQLCQIQVDKFTVGLRPSLQGLNTRAPKFQNFVQSFSASLYSFSFSLHATQLSLQLIFSALDCFSSLKELSCSMYFAA